MTPSWIEEYDTRAYKVVPKDAVLLDLDTVLGGVDMGGWEYVVGTLRKDVHARATRNKIADQIEAQTKPPRIAEPGLYGVVSSEDDRGLTTYFWHSHGGWHGENGSLSEWEDLVDPVLIRPGV